MYRIEKYDTQSNLALVISNGGYIDMSPDGSAALDPLKVKLPYKKD